MPASEATMEATIQQYVTMTVMVRLMTSVSRTLSTMYTMPIMHNSPMREKLNMGSGTCAPE